MQQEGVVSVSLPHPTSHVHASVLACVEAPVSESTVLVAAAGAQPTSCAGALVLGGGGKGLGWSCGLREQPLHCTILWSGSFHHALHFYTCKWRVGKWADGRGSGAWVGLWVRKRLPSPGTGHLGLFIIRCTSALLSGV